VGSPDRGAHNPGIYHSCERLQAGLINSHQRLKLPRREIERLSHARRGWICVEPTPKFTVGNQSPECPFHPSLTHCPHPFAIELGHDQLGNQHSN
jgi:hypothetical protein